ncbi:MAG: malto-oligosyltrehalose synthase [Myxococcota bacterium]|nr:malto-oligosyltrehalose synthase [Myxococcota bacterium]
MRIPNSTYRLQLHQGLGFAGAAALVDYLHRLGITDCYTSPLLAAAPGSNHGYDVVDHARLGPELGTEEELVEFATRLRNRQMGLVIDIVPNHMSIASGLNSWWTDVLENGPSSPYAPYFDIDWDPPKADLKAKVLLPILGDQFGPVLESGQIAIRYEGDTFVAAYGDIKLPIAPRTWSRILEPVLGELRGSLGDHAPTVHELESILTSLEHLPLRTETDRAKVRERRREKEIAKRRLAALLAAKPEARHALDQAMTSINGTPGDPESVDRLEALLADQGYRPSFWRVASDEINYRRFFDINELAAIRIEEPAVLRAVHAIPLRLVKQGLVTGLRIDHVDGLRAPSQYLHDLQHALGQATGGDGSRRFYVVVEKILGAGEQLPRDWPVHGTTGYEVAGLLTAVLVTAPGLAMLREVYQAFTHDRTSLADVIYESKRLVLKSAMSAELTVLARKLDDISEQHRASRDFTLNSLQEALGELIACFPVYRTYIDPHRAAMTDADRQTIQAAIDEAKRRNPATSASIFDFLRSLLLLEMPPRMDEAQVIARRDFVLRFQQLTSPVMAKGLEDTAYYRHVPVVALNEVGGCHEALTIEDLHAACAQRAAEMPSGMSATATHDTKRSEDVRARLGVLSEIPADWQQALVRLFRLALPHKRTYGVPAAAEEFLLFQVLLGAWPPGVAMPDTTFVARIQQYMNKALKEAKVHTSWINPNESYDAAVQQFIADLLAPTTSADFLAELGALRAKIERPGWFNSLSQLVLKIGMPGVPDFYQGTELWDDSLVDPDNRRPVDFARRAHLLDELRRDGEADPIALVDRLRATMEDGRIKMFVTTRALSFRRTHADVFGSGTYDGLRSAGTHCERVIAFARTYAGERVIVACGRHYTAIAEPSCDPIGARWGDTVISGAATAARYRDALTGRTIAAHDGVLALAEVFAHLPVAMLQELP